MKKFIVIAYDIVDDKKRNEISDLLLQYGRRVNRSVFECFLSNSEFEKLKRTLKEKIKPKEDIILYYHLCRDCIGRIEREGREDVPKEVVKVF